MSAPVYATQNDILLILTTPMIRAKFLHAATSHKTVKIDESTFQPYFEHEGKAYLLEMVQDIKTRFG